MSAAALTHGGKERREGREGDRATLTRSGSGRMQQQCRYLRMMTAEEERSTASDRYTLTAREHQERRSGEGNRRRSEDGEEKRQDTAAERSEAKESATLYAGCICRCLLRSAASTHVSGVCIARVRTREGGGEGRAAAMHESETYVSSSPAMAAATATAAKRSEAKQPSEARL